MLLLTSQTQLTSIPIIINIIIVFAHISRIHQDQPKLSSFIQSHTLDYIARFLTQSRVAHQVQSAGEETLWKNCIIEKKEKSSKKAIANKERR